MRYLILTLLGLTFLSCSEVAQTSQELDREFATSEQAVSTTPRRQLAMVWWIVNKMNVTTSQSNVLEDFITRAAAWRDEKTLNQGITNPPAFNFWRAVSGTQWMTPSGTFEVRFPGTFSELPVGNRMGFPFPNYLSGDIPGPPSWTSSFNGRTYLGTKVEAFSVETADTGWVQLGSSNNVNVIDIDDDMTSMIDVSEPDGYNTLNNSSGRTIKINSKIYELVTSSTVRDNWVWGAMFLAFNAGYAPITSTVGCTRAAARPAGCVQSDWDQLAAAWPTPALNTYPAGAPTAAGFKPVPGF